MSAVFPCVIPGTVTEHIADLVAGYRLAVIGCKQIAPGAVAVSVCYSIQRCTQRTGGVGVFVGSQDIARIIICPCAGITQ